MANSPESPPLPPCPSLDDLLVPPTPITVPAQCDLIPDDSSLDIFPPIDTHSPLAYMPPPIEIIFPETPDKRYSRGRSRSRSPPRRDRSPSPGPGITACGNPMYYTVPSFYDSRSCSPESSRSPSPPRRRRRYSYRSRTPSPPLMRRSYNYIPPIYPLPPPPMMSVPSMTPPPPVPPVVWPPSGIPISVPVDVLTFHYNKNMAYAPAAKTYDEAIDNVLELWPDLREFDRDRIQLFVEGANQIVRVPKMAWQLVMCDLPRYDIVHINVDQPPPPPQYQSDGKGNWASGDEKKDEKEKKQARSGGFFSLIKRIFRR